MKPRPSVETICQVHDLSRQAFYAERKRAKQRQAREEEALKVVNEERRQQPRIGVRKLYKMFKETFRRLKIGRDKLFELLRRKGLLVPRRRRTTWTTHWWHRLKVYANLAADLTPTRPNELWVSDITYVPVGDDFAYASIVTDAFSRKIVGYHLAPTLEAKGPIKALKIAMKQATSTEDLVHHSDQGVQYCCSDYVDLLEEHGCTISMTSGGNPYENAIAERVNGTLKNEYLLAQGFNAFEHARLALSEAVRLYNERRPHLSLDYEKPAEVYERGYLRAA